MLHVNGYNCTHDSWAAIDMMSMSVFAYVCVHMSACVYYTIIKGFFSDSHSSSDSSAIEVTLQNVDKSIGIKPQLCATNHMIIRCTQCTCGMR